MKAVNICPWLKRSSKERCSRKCVNEYCYIHRQQIIGLGRKPLVPCRACGVGTSSETLLCRACGSHRVASKLFHTEKRAHRDFALVLAAIKFPLLET